VTVYHVIPRDLRLGGPHLYKCNHWRCCWMRSLIESTCPVCRKQIGVDHEFVLQQGGPPVHRLCWEVTPGMGKPSSGESSNDTGHGSRLARFT
jgi:hypothetical protein